MTCSCGKAAPEDGGAEGVPFYADDAVTLWHGDCLDVMRELAAGSIDAIVTSPPYAEQRASTYGGVGEDEYPAWTVEWMREARRVLKPAGSALIVISPHVRDGQISDYVLRTRLALRADGWVEPDEIVWTKPDPMPSGSPDRPNRGWESILWFSPSRRPACFPRRNGRPQDPKVQERSQRHFVGGRAGTVGWEHNTGGSQKFDADFSRCLNHVSSPVRLVRNDAGEHPAMFSVPLAQWMVRLVTPPGGTVLEPFAGSGTTAEACVVEGFRCIAIEREATYLPLIVKRLSKPIQVDLFGGAA